MTAEDQERVSRIGKGYRWADVEGRQPSFLTTTSWKTSASAPAP
jgi:hypothetical protein